MASSEDSSSESSPIPKDPKDSSSVSDLSMAEGIKTPDAPPRPGDWATHNVATLHARAYQMEMFEKSKDENIIVAMDTGSGKTQVATLRIQAELDKSCHDKTVWFLAPTVALCSQQFKVLQLQITGAQIKMLSGNDNVDAWSDVLTWNAFLADASIVVSTYQILLDALSHKFVKMSNLSLIVFDEAHNCVKKHPGSKIMGFYKDNKEAGMPIPSILGLSASPVMSSSLTGLDLIEMTLDAVCRTPLKHREELLSYVKPPSLCRALYRPGPGPKDVDLYTESMKSLDHVLRNLDIHQDPYIIRQKADKSERGCLKLEKALWKEDTYTFRQMRSLQRKSTTIRCELGPWAADYFISTSITQYLDYVKKENSKLCAAWDIAEKNFLADTLREVTLSRLSPHDDMQLSGKVTRLIDVLLEPQDKALGIIFAKETATVHILQKLLSVHPMTRNRFRIGSMVGTSRYPGRKKDVGELNKDDGKENLEDFRSAKLDILVATSVLEEGIDVPACNLVICFDEPANLKVFIQRRGRARMRESKLVLLLDEGSDSNTQWETLENNMKKQYENDERHRLDVKELEKKKDPDLKPFYTRRKRAKLDFDAGKQHLQHFCDVLTTSQFVECSPYYITKTVSYDTGPSLTKATVVLPNPLRPHLRRIEGIRAWHSEKDACKDAAFQAYVMLYKAGLVNENLMPSGDDDDVLESEACESEVVICERWNPWTSVAKAWSGSKRYQRLITITEKKVESEITLCRFDVIMPTPIPAIPQFNVYWVENPWRVSFSDEINERVVGEAPETHQTMALIASANDHRFRIKEGGQHIVRFNSAEDHISTDHFGSQPFKLDLTSKFDNVLPYLVRTPDNDGLHFYESWLSSKPPPDLVQSYGKQDHANDDRWLALRKWSKRRNFLRPISRDPKSLPPQKPYEVVWPVSSCRVDSTPIINVQFGSLIPSITHMIEIYLVALELSTTVLKDLNFQDLKLVVTAISASSANETTDYKRLRFIGDSILKLLATISVAANYPNHPEGFLCKKIVRLISNRTLCRSARKAGLDKFILTAPFGDAMWQPIYVDDILSPPSPARPGSRKVSTKIFSDVAKALIGASYLDGGEQKALKCVRLLVSGIEWYGLVDGRLALSSIRPSKTELPATLITLESLIGYKFTNKLLLTEAVTHGSYNAGSSTDWSLECLELLGDAILEKIIMSKIWKSGKPYKIMTLLRSACVHTDLLGFLGMELRTTKDSSEIDDGRLVKSQVNVPFWSFMRHSSTALGAEQKATQERHLQVRERILHAIEHSPTYPWALLAHLNLLKFYSDIFKSVLAAVWIDSGDMNACEGLVDRIRVSHYLKRILADGVDVAHPKNKLAELVGEKSLRYEVDNEDAPSTNLRCKVFDADKLIIEVDGGLNKDEVITKAAEAAFELLKGTTTKESRRKQTGHGAVNKQTVLPSRAK